MKCKYCNENCIKKGCYKNKQLYKCKVCFKYQRLDYSKISITTEKINSIKIFIKEGLSISSISRILKIAKSTVLIYITQLASKIVKPIFVETNHEYEIDELRTFTNNKENECWIIYAINKTTKKVIDFAVGKRNKLNIKKVVDTVLLLNPKRIFTDKLNIYPTLITNTKHITTKHKINHIERKNLDLRKDIKCLNRKTICYSKSEVMLVAKLNPLLVPAEQKAGARLWRVLFSINT